MDSRKSQQINLPSEFLRRGPYVCLHIWEKHATGVRLHCFCQVPVFLVLKDISVWVTPAVLVIVTWGLWAHDESATYISMIPDEHTSSKHHSAIADGSYHFAWTTRRGFIHYSFIHGLIIFIIHGLIRIIFCLKSQGLSAMIRKFTQQMAQLSTYTLTW